MFLAALKKRAFYTSNENNLFLKSKVLVTPILVMIRFLKTFVPSSSTATGTLTSWITLPRTLPRETSGARPASAS
jgi:hypothetical protein